MTRTQTMLTQEQARAALAELQEFTETWQAAVRRFAEKYNADSVGVLEMVEHTDAWLYDIEADISTTYDEE